MAPKQENKKTSIWAILSIVSAVFSFLMGFEIDPIWFPIFGLLGVVFGIVALIKIKNDSNLKGKDLAIWGILVNGWIVVYSALWVYTISNLVFG